MLAPLVLCGAALLVAACGAPLGREPDGGSLTDGGSGSDAGWDAGAGWDGGLGLSCSGASPSFAADVHPVLSGCGGEMCHGGLAIGAWPYTSLVNVHAARDTCNPALVLVTPGRIDQSYLLNKLTGIGMCPNTSRMPVNGVQLAQLQLIVDWICQGAQNN